MLFETSIRSGDKPLRLVVVDHFVQVLLLTPAFTCKPLCTGGNVESLAARVGSRERSQFALLLTRIRCHVCPCFAETELIRSWCAETDVE